MLISPHMILTKTSYYNAPDCVVFQSIMDFILCTSPEDGGLEGVEYEDLVI